MELNMSRNDGDSIIFYIATIFLNCFAYYFHAIIGYDLPIDYIVSSLTCFLPLLLSFYALAFPLTKSLHFGFRFAILAFTSLTFIMLI